MIITLRFFEELNDFLPLEKRKIAFDRNVAAKTSVKDVIESLGVPHPEVDLILVNGRSVDFSYQVREHDSISVYPTFESFDITDIIRVRPKPLRKTRFILDVHLGKLARYLRLLGFDAEYNNHYSDKTIIKRSQSEHRIILTRDVPLLKNKKITHGYWLRTKDKEKQIIEVLQRFDLTKQCDPFTRCLECNGLLKSIDKEKISNLLSPKVKKYHSHFTECQSCKKIYWEGTHYQKLKSWIKTLKIKSSF